VQSKAEKKYKDLEAAGGNTKSGSGFAAPTDVCFLG
jgi:hypothetical protein